MKKLILGLIIGLLIGSAGTALASSDYVQATFAKFNIAVDSEESVEVEALVREGTSYYPIRVIADMLDHEVDYIDETRTIVIEKPKLEPILEEELTNETSDFTGGDEMEVIEGTENETPSELDEITLEGINSLLENARLALRATELTLIREISDEVRIQTEQQKEEIERRIAEYEQKKLELESK